jgi:hypothetical protein
MPDEFSIAYWGDLFPSPKHDNCPIDRAILLPQLTSRTSPPDVSEREHTVGISSYQ